MRKRNDSYPLVHCTEMDDLSTSNISRPTRKQNDKSDKDISSSFLEILRKLLDECDHDGHNIASWNADGLSFCINDSQRFEHYLIPVYFGSSDSCCTTDHQQNQHQMDEPLQTFDAFLERLRSHGFISTFDPRFYSYIYSHPEFGRDTKYSRFQLTSNQPRNTWPNHCDNIRTASRIPSQTTEEYQSRPLRTGVSKRDRPIGASSSNHKRKRRRDHRRRVDPTLNHRIDDWRTPSSRISQHTKQTSFHELLRYVSSCDSENNNKTNDDFEPLCVSTNCNALLGVVDLASSVFETKSTTHPNESKTPSDSAIDVEPLDPDGHNDDGSLHEDIAEALSRI